MFSNFFFSGDTEKQNRVLSRKIERLERKLKNLENIKEKNSFFLKKIISEVDEAKQLIQQKDKEILKLASQVSHDIRSPLTALDMVTQDLSALSEDQRIIIRGAISRIKDIANNLLSKNKMNRAKALGNEEQSVELLSSAIEEIVTEKRIAYRNKLNLSLETDILNGHSYGLFASINLLEFKVILSNLINNSVEALFSKGMEHKGKIVISLKVSPNECNKLQIIIEDNGKGIPTHILPSLFREGGSFGKDESKESGNGLGLFHAKKVVEEKWKGNIEIKSCEGEGTKVILTLPRENSPWWFVPKLELKQDQTLVILDDDQGIHQTWNQRFREKIFEDMQIRIIHVSNPHDFKSFLSELGESCKNENFLYLSDFELMGHKESGLDILEEFNLKNAILVTSHYESEKIKNRCKKLGIRLIPKNLACYIPFEVENIPLQVS